MSDPGTGFHEEESKQFDSTISEHSTARPLEDKGKREDTAVQRPLTVAPVFPPRIDYSSASDEIDGNVYLAYAFPRPRRNRAPNHDPPDYREHPEHTHRAIVVTWDRETGLGTLLERQSRTILEVAIEDIKSMYGALIVGTEVIFQLFNWKFHNFWVNNDRYYVLYWEAAICEARYPYMRYQNDSRKFDPNRDYFQRPPLEEKDVNTHLEIYSIRHSE